MGARPRFGVRAKRWCNGRTARVGAAVLASLTVALAAPAHAARADDTGDTWVYPSRLDDGLAPARLDRCRLGFVAQAGGPAIRGVAQTARHRNPHRGAAHF